MTEAVCSTRHVPYTEEAKGLLREVIGQVNLGRGASKQLNQTAIVESHTRVEGLGYYTYNDFVVAAKSATGWRKILPAKALQVRVGENDGFWQATVNTINPARPDRKSFVFDLSVKRDEATRGQIVERLSAKLAAAACGL